MPEPIHLTYPTDPELAEARRLLARYGLTSRQEVIALATYGTADNPRRLLVAAGQLVLTLRCHVCGEHHLDPAHKDATPLELCPRCYEEGGLENEHSDYGHPTPVMGCPACPGYDPESPVGR